MEINRKGKILVNQLEVYIYFYIIYFFPPKSLSELHFENQILKYWNHFINTQGLTKEHEVSLKKQQDDVNSLGQHLDHVISFTKWATASHSGTALLYCKRLVGFVTNYATISKDALTLGLVVLGRAKVSIASISVPHWPTLVLPQRQAKWHSH